MKHNLMAIAVTTGLLATQASATTVNVTYQDPNNLYGSLAPVEQVLIEAPANNGNPAIRTVTNAGLFQLTGDNGIGNFAAFCVEIYQSIVDGAEYETPVALFTGSTLGRIDRLFSSSYAAVTDAVNAAAFQVALWEVIYDDDYDLDGGNFLTGLDNGAEFNPAVETQAEAFLLDSQSAPTGVYTLTFWESETAQDLVSVDLAPVPLPAPALLLLGGLGGLAAMRKRRKA